MGDDVHPCNAWSRLGKFTAASVTPKQTLQLPDWRDWAIDIDRHPVPKYYHEAFMTESLQDDRAVPGYHPSDVAFLKSDCLAKIISLYARPRNAPVCFRRWFVGLPA